MKNQVMANTMITNIKQYVVKETAWHTEDMCDKCGKKVGKNNLKPVPFLYLDKNDKFHPNLGNYYRQYYVCKNCIKTYKQKVIL